MNKTGFGLQVPKSAHVPLLAAGFALLLFTAVAVIGAPFSEWFQTSDRGLPAGANQPKDTDEPAATNTASESNNKTRCKHCGIIESTRQVGAVHEVTVRLADRSTHVFSDPNPASWRPGERIILIGGGNSPRH